jgi:hypothetical protein
MSRKFEYKGPEVVESCRDCLYRQFGSDEVMYCFHPDNPEIEEQGWMSSPEKIPEWCPLPKEDL